MLVAGKLLAILGIGFGSFVTYSAISTWGSYAPPAIASNSSLVDSSSSPQTQVPILTREQESQLDSCVENTAFVIVELNGKEERIRLADLNQKMRENPQMKLKDTDYKGQCKIQDTVK